MPADRGASLKARIGQLGLTSRVEFHPAYRPEDAVREAARHTVGLCLEREGIRNQELTVSNKIFDYHMAGLAVVASDLPGLAAVIERSGGGLLFKPGSPEDLAAKIITLYHNRALLKQLADNARKFAYREGNRQTEMKKFIDAFRDTCRKRLGTET